MLLCVCDGSFSISTGWVYLKPNESSVQVGETADVEIWVNASDVQGGQINLTYDPSIINVTSFVINETRFPSGLPMWWYINDTEEIPLWHWNSTPDGREWILFAANYSEDNIPLTGDYKIGTLTIEGISPGTAELGFGFGDDNSSLFDDYGNETTVNWVGGSVGVVEGMCGDVNVDGKVDFTDAGLVARNFLYGDVLNCCT